MGQRATTRMLRITLWETTLDDAVFVKQTAQLRRAIGVVCCSFHMSVLVHLIYSYASTRGASFTCRTYDDRSSRDGCRRRCRPDVLRAITCGVPIGLASAARVAREKLSASLTTNESPTAIPSVLTTTVRSFILPSSFISHSSRWTTREIRAPGSSSMISAAHSPWG